jgi:hypothetical protein
MIYLLLWTISYARRLYLSHSITLNLFSSSAKHPSLNHYFNKPFGLYAPDQYIDCSFATVSEQLKMKSNTTFDQPRPARPSQGVGRGWSRASANPLAETALKCSENLRAKTWYGKLTASRCVLIWSVTFIAAGVHSA